MQVNKTPLIYGAEGAAGDVLLCKSRDGKISCLQVSASFDFASYNLLLLTETSTAVPKVLIHFGESGG